MRVGIVGAGIAGLAAARELRTHGADVVVFEKAKAVGGRCATRRIDGFTFDVGATSIAPRGKSLEQAMLTELDTSDLVKIAQPIYVHESLRVSSGDSGKNRIERYAYRSGNRRLAELLAIDVDVRLNQLVEGLEKNAAGGYRILGEPFDAVILTPPAPQTMQLLASIGEFRPLSSVTYRMCLSLLLGYNQPAPTSAYHALIEVEQRHPLTWLCLESVKCPDRAPEGQTALVAQMSPDFSHRRFDDDDAAILDSVALYIERLYGPDWAAPQTSYIHRWRFSQPEMTAMFDSTNHAHSKLVIAGDSVVGGRIEYAFESGLKAARSLVAQ